MISRRFLKQPPQQLQPPETLTLHRKRNTVVSARPPRAQQAENKARVSSAAKKIERERITPDQRRKQAFLAHKQTAMIVANEARRLVVSNNREKESIRRSQNSDGLIASGARRSCAGSAHPAPVPPVPPPVAVRAAGSAADTAGYGSSCSPLTLRMASRRGGTMTAPFVRSGGGHGGSGGSLSAALLAAGAMESPASSPHLGHRSSTMHPGIKEAMTTSNNIAASTVAAGAELPASDEARVPVKARKRRVSLKSKKVQNQKEVMNRLMHGRLCFPRPIISSCPPSRIPPPVPRHQQSVVTKPSAAQRCSKSRSSSKISKDMVPPSGMSVASTHVPTTSESDVSVPAADSALMDGEANVAEMSNEELIRELALEMVERQRLDEKVKHMTGGLGIETGGVEVLLKKLSEDDCTRKEGSPQRAPSPLSSSEDGVMILPYLSNPVVSEDSRVCGRELESGSPSPFSPVPGCGEGVLSRGNGSKDDHADQTSSVAIVAGARRSLASAPVAEIASILRDAVPGPRGARMATVDAAESSAKLNMRASISSAGWSDYDRRRQDVTCMQRDVTAAVDVAVDNRANEIILEVARARCAKQSGLRRHADLTQHRNAVELAAATVAVCARRSALAEGEKRLADVQAEAAPYRVSAECHKKRPQPARPPFSGRERRRQPAPPAQDDKAAWTSATPVGRLSRGVPSHVANSRAQAWIVRKPLQQPPWRP